MPGYGHEGMPPKPSSNLVWGILTTLLCCLPFGIVSIVQAAKVDSLYMAGRYAEAQNASDSARKWAIIAAVTGLVLAALWGILVMGMGFSSYESTGF